jgi:DNA-binding beta-propeller fold protein YncE
MKHPILLATFTLALAVGQAASAQTGTAAVVSEPGKVGVAQTIEATATITAIDKATRGLTLKGPKGNEIKLTAGPDVKNFDQLKVGDTVAAQYVEALVLELKKGGGKPVARTEQSGMARAKPGEAPGGAMVSKVTVVGDVIALDAATQKVTVRGPHRTVDLHVRDPEQFKLISKGDQIEATYAEAMAIAVTPKSAPAKK